MKIAVVLVLGLLIAAGCGNPINRKTAQNYAGAGYQAINAGDWKLAQKNFGKAIVNAELGGAEPQHMAVLKYEYGRASGVVCDWTNAEAALKEAFNLDAANGGPSYMALYELGRMHFDRKQFAKARSYYDQVYLEFGKVGVETKDPLGFAQYLEEYVVILQETGAQQDAMTYQERAAKIRGMFPEGKSPTEKTPYGTQCA